jgi:HlyD family secretion protein
MTSHSPDAAAAQARQTRQQFVSPDDYLSYELGKAVRELPPLYTRLLAATLTTMVFGAIAWMAMSKVDEVAIANGEIIPSQQVRPVRALDGGIIDTIHVQEGDYVQRGDVLITQDSTLNTADVARIQQAATLIQQDIARLEAERAGNSATGTPLQDQLLEARLQEYNTRRQEAIAEANRQRAIIDETRTRVARLQGNLQSARETLVNAEQREASLSSLVEDGVVARLDYLEAVDRLTSARDQVATIQREIEAQQQTVRQNEQSLQAALATVNRLDSERQSEILTQLNRRQEELSEITGQLNQAQIRSDGDVIRAPVTGRVYKLDITAGERAIAPGEELLSILPDGQDLVLEVRILNRDIGFVSEGMRAKVKVATFPFQEFGTIEGVLEQISPNAQMDEQLGLVYTARVVLNRTAIPVRGQEVPLAPGMAATAEIVTRQKTVLTFLLEPVTRRFDEAFSVR